MATMVIGSKSGIFHLNKNTWHCMTELQSDVLIEVQDFSFLLHKFPLINMSPVLQKILGKFSSDEDTECTFALDEIPGGADSFELIAKFCYGEKIELTSSNVVPLLCAAYYLNMNEVHMEGNLISQTEAFLSNKVLSDWKESIIALVSCEPVLHRAEKQDIVSRCLNSLARKITNGKSSYPQFEMSWNGIMCMKEIHKSTNSGSDWWHKDICSLSLYLFKRLIGILDAKGHDPVDISNAVIYYASNHHFRLNPKSTGIWSVDERMLLEEIVNLLPVQNGATKTKDLLNMLSASIMLDANEECTKSLEKRVGAQLDIATVEELLVLKTGAADKAVYYVDCIKRLIEQFMEENNSTEQCSKEADSLREVAKLVDECLKKMAVNANLKLEQFLSLASAIPMSARPSSDDLYHAISAYLEHHAHLSDGQKEQICQLIDVQKLSRDVCRDVAQNENLPVRVIVKALFCEMLDLKRSLLNGGNGNNTATEDGISSDGGNDMIVRCSELRKECENLKKEINETENSKGTKLMWQFFWARNSWSGRVKALITPSKQ